MIFNFVLIHLGAILNSSNGSNNFNSSNYPNNSNSSNSSNYSNSSNSYKSSTIIYTVLVLKIWINTIETDFLNKSKNWLNIVASILTPK